ncbi:MAG TPA: hypothetical protein VFK09_11090 [Gemmatimonadales bacterium]|nr:hypothetical protein [Gemmatimonadales bacterium]
MLRQFQRITPLLLVATASWACSDSTNPTDAAGRASLNASHNAVDGAAFGFTAGWLNGRTVQFFYHKPFFCATPVEDGQPVGSTSGCEVGSDGTEDPRPGNIPTLFVLTPMGFRPDASTLHCPVVGQCINHPSTIDLSRLFGPSTANAPLPAHSHVINQVNGNWWELDVVGVKDLATWNQVVAGKSLATVRALQAADPGAEHITADIPSNTYLFFDVRPASGT